MKNNITKKVSDDTKINDDSNQYDVNLSSDEDDGQYKIISNKLTMHDLAVSPLSKSKRANLNQ